MFKLSPLFDLAPFYAKVNLLKGQGHSLTLVKGHSDFKVKCLTFGLYTQVSDSGPLGPLVFWWDGVGVGGAVKGFQNTHSFKFRDQGTKAVLQFFLNQSACAKLALKLGIAKLQIQGLSH